MPHFSTTLALGLVLSSCGAVSATRDRPPPTARELRVGLLIVDGVYDTELMAPFDVFHHTRFHAQPGMSVFTVAPALDPVRTFEGLRLLPDFTFQSAPPIDVLVV